MLKRKKKQFILKDIQQQKKLQTKPSSFECLTVKNIMSPPNVEDWGHRQKRNPNNISVIKTAGKMF